MNPYLLNYKPGKPIFDPDGNELRPVPGFSNEYFASQHGDVWSGKFNRLRKLSQFSCREYLSVTAGGRKLLVHHAIALTWIGPRPEGAECLHLNGQPRDNRAENLKWATRQEVVDNEIARGTHYKPAPGTPSSHRRLTDQQVELVRIRLLAGETARTVAEDFNVTTSAISLLRTGRTYKRPAESKEAA